ncbi:cell division protein SepF [Oxobacter pfennigii]|uniref:Cell division protein SepF n=1 Tax=Oxobacter pfennigii TaxID=36849 RepID=A0A0P9AFK2_9CLOT|nr:cell division protein SepF [Oxobacter pfennigii]KPU44138.1 cell division protein SepF [Oxobacter pfennigii]
MGNAIVSKVLDFIGIGDDSESYGDSKMQKDLQDDLYNAGSEKVLRVHSAANTKVILSNPLNFDDMLLISDHLKCKKIVIMDLKNLDDEEAKRCLDYICGTVFVLECGIHKISSRIFLITPANVAATQEF